MPNFAWASAAHWMVAFWSHVEPAPSTVTLPACATCGRADPVDAATASTTPASIARRIHRRALPEPAIHVVRCARVVGVAEDLRRRPDLHDLARLALVHVEERALV